MNPADVAAQSPQAAPALSRSRGTLRRMRLPVYLACTVLALLANYWLGKEMAWDTLNYHMYAGLSAVHDRLNQDYFAAGPQSYVNPYAYLLFYTLVASGLPALVVASLLAAVHSMILWLTFELALVAFPSGNDGRRVTLAICATVLAAINPVYTQQIGSSFSDITTAELVLAGWLLLAKTVQTPGHWRVALAGLLLGAATALKMTNAVHAIAATAILVALEQPIAAKLRYAALYIGSTGAAFAVVALPWAYRMEVKFGNPFFPLLNNIFRSPHFTTEPLRHLRFIPASLGEALWRPFAMLDPTYMVHEELMAPDPRYAVLLVIACGCAIRWLWRRRGGRYAAGTPGSVNVRVLAALGSGFLVDWVLWLAGSGNSRYFIPMACVCGVLVIGLLLQLLPSAPRARAYILGVLCVTQAMQLSWGSELRWNSVPWDGGKWFDVDVPNKLATEPALYLSIGIQSDSFLVPYLGKGAAFVDFSGGYPLSGSGANGQAVQSLIRNHAPYLRMLSRGKRLYADGEGRSPRLSEVDAVLVRFGLRVDPTDCATITVNGLPPDLEPSIVSSTPAEPLPKDKTYIVSCRLLPDSSDHSRDIAEQRQADIVLDRLEDACPALFQPRRVPTDARGAMSRRLYMNSDVVAWVSYGWVKFQEPLRGDDMVVLGSESEWLKGPVPLVCGRRQGHYFARVLSSSDAR